MGYLKSRGGNELFLYTYFNMLLVMLDVYHKLYARAPSQPVVSESVLATEEFDFSDGERHAVNIRGRIEPLAIRVFMQTRDLPRTFYPR